MTSTTPAAAIPHDRQFLESVLHRYLLALAAGDPRLAPLAADAVFAENDQPLPAGAASWQTLDALGRYRHVFCDLETGEVAAIANAREAGSGVILIVRLKLRAQQIVEAEQFVIRDPGAYDRYEELGVPDPVWLEPIPAERRQSREALEAISWMYFQGLERNDGAGIYPFTHDCDRLEHARPSVNRPSNESYGHADNAVEFTTLKARQQYALGMMGYISRVRERRVLAIDVERGAVLGSALFDMDGMTRKVDLSGGGVFEIPAYFRTPRTHHMNEAFKVVSGSFRSVEMTFCEVPYGTRAVWRKPATATRTDIRFAPPPAPLNLQSRGELIRLVDRFLDALVRCCPCDLPLADDVVYVENGVRVELGDGLWKSISGRGAYRIHLADVASGQAAFFGSLDENGFFAMVAARLKIGAGLITEIEVVIARPERADEWGNLGHATHTLFVPPLLADLSSRAFGAPTPVLSEAPQRPVLRAALLQAVTSYFAGFESKDSADVPFAAHCVRRENGIVASGNAAGPIVDAQRPDFGVFAGNCAAQLDQGYFACLASVRRRPLVVDEESGLVLDLALFDHAGSTEPVDIRGVGGIAVAESFRSPSTDLHAQLFKIDAGQIAAIEDLVRRVPYGQSSPWDTPLRAGGNS